MKIPNFLPFYRFLMTGLGVLCFSLLMDIILGISGGRYGVPDSSVVALAIISGCCFLGVGISLLLKDQD